MRSFWILFHVLAGLCISTNAFSRTCLVRFLWSPEFYSNFAPNAMHTFHYFPYSMQMEKTAHTPAPERNGFGRDALAS